MVRPLRIGVNALFLIPGGVGGTEIYLRHLLEALAQIDSENLYHVFINRETAGAAPPLVPVQENFCAVECPVRAVNRAARLLWEQLALPLQGAGRHLDVWFSPGFTSPWCTPVPRVTVIHDLQHKRQPQNFGALELAAWRLSVWASAYLSRRIVTVSESARRDIVEIYRLPQERVAVVPHGVDRVFFGLCQNEAVARTALKRFRIGDEPYMLAVSTLHRHKNWERFLDAYEHLAAAGLPHHLVIAGLAGNYYQELVRRIAQPHLKERVHLTGWVSPADLLALYKFAAALIFPSTFEGFGLPVLEAMAAGVPLACSDIPPLRELAGEAALFFDPESVESIEAQVGRLLGPGMPDVRMVQAGQDKAADYTWLRAAEQTLQILRRAAG